MRGAMRIRLADKDRDFPAILEGARAFAASTPAHARALLAPLDSAAFAANLRGFLGLEAVGVSLAVGADGRALAGLGFFVGPYPLNPARVEWHEMFWWAAPDAPAAAALGVLRHALRRGKAKGATIATAHALETSPAGVDRIYRRLGLLPVQRTYIGSL
jgi:hypothetical protein